MEDAEGSLIEMQFPDAALGQVVGAALAGDGRAFLGFNFGVKAVDSRGWLRRDWCRVGIRLLLQQFQPEWGCVGIAEQNGRGCRTAGRGYGVTGRGDDHRWGRGAGGQEEYG